MAFHFGALDVLTVCVCVCVICPSSMLEKVDMYHIQRLNAIEIAGSSQRDLWLPIIGPNYISQMAKYKNCLIYSNRNTHTTITV